ncbi:MAG: TOTE conflict system archaeo-eukaryotic primase domain-containing protein [Planctomycetota bacterium]|jgi:hypothetical protein
MKDIKLVLQLKIFFKGREDTFSEQKSDGSYIRVDRLLHLEDFQEHLEGRKTIGIYLIDPKDNMVNFCAFDIDNKDNHVLRAILNACLKTGLQKENILIEDSGNKGRHIFFRFEKPVLAKDARAFLEIILKLTGLDLNIELFPKQDRVNKDNFGNLIKLPLGIHKESGNRSYFMDFDNLKETDKDILFKVKDIKCI